MKSSFSRSFVPAITILLMALVTVGVMFQMLARNVMEQRVMQRLETQAQTVSRLSSAYYNHGIEREEEFFISFSVASQVSGYDTVICDQSGSLLLCSDAPMGCDHQGLQIGRDYLSRVLSTGYAESTMLLHGLYDEPRFVVSVPILDSSNGPVGIVVVSTPIADTLDALRSLSHIYLLSCAAVIVVAIAIMIWVARNHSRPLSQMRKAAVAFGHGDLDARVEVKPTYPEEIQELALAFNNMAASLQKSEYQRQEFVANVSHELKTPMTTIAGFADGILDGTIPQKRQTHYLQLISEETKRLNRLVRSMLDTARLQENQSIPAEQKSRFDVTESAGQVLLSFEQKITAKNLDVQVDMPDYPVYTRAQQDQITQVLYNLMDNAVKFCPEAGQLGLTLRTGGNKIYVSVRNSGKTIPSSELPLVFDRFHKLDKSRTENRDGWGLGLYIVKTIICAHGENISVVSRDGQTEFTFTLPLVN
ncbi:MAG: HAMP domain-containing histidine kinase [Oscillospiraceae bacterium]|nr:HAMP domain-containing histidine kinase [Oscillospiraceae bacterium]